MKIPDTAVSGIFLMELRMIQRAVEAAVCNELVVIALLDDVAVLEHQNGIGILNGREAMGDDEACTSLHQRIHSLLDADLGT